jgi:hypothetical protein
MRAGVGRLSWKHDDDEAGPPTPSYQKAHEARRRGGRTSAGTRLIPVSKEAGGDGGQGWPRLRSRLSKKNREEEEGGGGWKAARELRSDI